MARQRKFSIEELYQSTKELLLERGYEGFTFSILASQLDVSRGTIYKYFENKEELIMEYMIYEMNIFLEDLTDIQRFHSFETQLEFLLELMFDNVEIQQLIEIGQQVPDNTSSKAKEHKERLDHLHLELYNSLQSFIQLGKDEQKIKEHLPDSLVLGFIFQAITIPNHYGVPHKEWVKSIKEIIRHGMFIKVN
ncbi:TetR/AcrR family transcriptional regulator [Tenuibacillus multivorans]|uniref:DNA-binding transcriptional regulator, AcrR family n=1 Tax=Tenuibacillus multivorans TaxID=237069 RepID=A0A1H0DXB8_9BACI|nr:TetR/AcrR family transcriptional regulator [Tenuibacillus multivorans]GEL76741.1 hypothetical protein TMU01_09760 [Tenuibacillus multivorans]SDN74790.1 DNA-binding transcriptional regulator, AcrR family [Tenuibacillus multivorans]